MSKVYYSYHPITGEFVGIGYSTEDKKYAPGIDIFPANCTQIKPPQEQKGFKIVWNGTSWEHEKQLSDAGPDPEVPQSSWVDKRKQEYPPITDYLDAVVKKDSGLIEEYIQKCLAVKARYPKE